MTIEQFSKNEYLVNNNALYEKHTEHLSTTEPLWLDGMPGSDNIVYKREIPSVEQPEEPIEEDTHEYVDLGLPSGTLWATMNVGATTETEYGNYYRYGTGAATYQETDSQSVYNGAEDTLPANVDTASTAWGGDWYTPTKEQCQELIDNTTIEWVTNYQDSGVNGATFTANGQTLFIPAAGYYPGNDLSNVGEYGYVWSSNCDNNQEQRNIYVVLTSHNITDVANILRLNRNSGYSVRPVKDAPVEDDQWVDPQV